MSDFKRQSTENLDILLSGKTHEKPRFGWIRAVREGLWMSTHQLAKRLQISQSAIINLEKREIRGTITLASLEKVANALGCHVEVRFIPDKPIKQFMMKQAMDYSRMKLASVLRTMALENQALTEKDVEDRIKAMAEELIQKGSSKIWNTADEF